MESKNMFPLRKVAIRMVDEPPLYSDVSINGPEAAIKVMADTLKSYDREVVAVVNLRTDLKPINVNIVSMGALDQCIVHPREAIKSMVLSNAFGVMLVHNHPSGRVTPSREDVALTDKMAQICKLIDIKLLDHIIVGPGNEYYSFHEKGVMPLAGLSFETDVDKIKLEGLKVAENTVLEKPKVKQIASLTVAECSEFHSMGEEHTGVSSAKEAIEIFKSIPPERMNGIPAIGVRVTNADSPELFTEIDIFRGNRFDMEVLDYVPEIRDDWNAQKMIAELIHAYPEAEILGDIPEGVQKKLQFIESREKQAEKLKDVTDQLEKGVADIFQSDKYKEYLNVMAKFPHYSVNNSILIMMQKPDAQICQSYTGWKEMGRYVKKGEKGINILAPAPYKIEREQQKLDANGKPMFDRDGEPITEKVEVTIRAFKVVKTFDVSQTDGKELPNLGVNELVGNIDGYSKLLEALQAVCPVPVSFENIPDNSKGYFHLMDKRIVVQDGMSEVQTIKTLIHEMAHQKLHDKDLVAEAANISRNGKEVEAESVAYVVCQHFGINTSDYSFSYVAGWSKGKETPELKASLGKIRETAADFISRIDEKLEELVSHKTQEQVTEQQVSVKEDKPVNRKEELAQLLSATAAQCYVDGKGTHKKKTTKKESVKLKIQAVKELPKKEPAKKSKTKAKEERA